ncbi:MAG: phosphoribosylformylglycinamidine synthase subunit PurL [Candidatus Margulisbacteria bacterium]|nr:phosphoribosylformylglycinamidine synthase subunit PurL [Candidatus Margulisiibacteriota bacterium]
MINKELIAEHGLSTEDYERICKILNRHPNITELGMYSVLWSEHCSYKHSKPLLKLFPTKGPQVLQGPGENAGIVDIGDGLAVSFKIESHNHPSYLEPYQGAATGVGGIIRDVFTMGARPVASLNSLRFGSIETGNKHMKYLVNGVVGGIAGYGNCIGVPTIGGEVYFSDSYNGNILVNAMCIGIVQSGETKVDDLYGPIVRGKAAGIGNKVFYVGAATGRDGIHGATFASVELSEESQESRSSVQVGDPFMEKLLLEACLELIKTGIVVGMQDMGAAGLTSSTSEMAGRSGTGIELNLDHVPRREEGMTPYEIMLSESQERMVVIVEKGKEKIAIDIFEKWGLHAVDIGKVTDDKMLRLIEKGKVVAEVPARSLSDDAPVVEAEAKEPYYIKEVQNVMIESLPDLDLKESGKIFLQLLAIPSIANKNYIYEQYDHMVQTNTMIIPGKADAAVIRIKGSNKKLAATTDCNGRYCYLDPFRGGKATIAEAARNLVCVGAKPLAVTDCLNFGNPEKSEIFWQFKKAVEGMSEACQALDTPVISGNVSFYNESNGEAIYPTPVVGMVGIIPENVQPVNMAFKNDQDLIILLGKTKNAIGGTEYLKIKHGMETGKPPAIHLDFEKRLQNVILKAVNKNLINSAHDTAEGGLIIALAECAITGNKGVNIDLEKSNKLRNDALLFGESQSRIIISCHKNSLNQIKALAEEEEIPCQLLGKVQGDDFNISLNGEKIISYPIRMIDEIYNKSFEKIIS